MFQQFDGENLEISEKDFARLIDEVKKIENIAKNLVTLKNEFAKNHSKNSHIQEVIPLSKTDSCPIDKNHLKKLHLFASNNPIYNNSYEEKISNMSCMVYEGDINEYWLSSIKQGSSYQPFYPTWILSAYIKALLAKILQYKEIIDVGSGDGRIAYCSKILDLEAYGIEIDEELVKLQKLISHSTQIYFNPHCADATRFDYSDLNLKKPAFFIGGLAQMGGDILATSIIEKINSVQNLKKTSGIIFTGSNSNQHLSSKIPEGGWADIIEKYDLRIIKRISLPTIWTFNQTDATLYIFTTFR